MEFTNLQYEGINMGACGKIDLIFMQQAAIRWDELANAVSGGRKYSPPLPDGHEPEEEEK